jgi:hypothetical protein
MLQPRFEACAKVAARDGVRADRARHKVGFTTAETSEHVMDFRLRGLDIDQFGPLFGMADRELTDVAVMRQVVDTAGACPDRIELVDA